MMRTGGLTRRAVRGLGRFYLLARGGANRFLSALTKPLFQECGRNVRFDAWGNYSYSTISIGNDVYIGPGAKFSASDTTLKIGNKVQFGPNVTIMAGDHNTSVVGQYMFDVHEKLPEDDQPVVLEDDVWVGAGATILKGVRIGRGAIVAAEALVRESAPPYSIVVGVPAKILRFRWTVDEILAHERELYPEDQRLSRQELRAIIESQPR